MTNKRNKFFTFLCSLLPGAGEMYMGFMKQGISLMSAFFLVWAVSDLLNLPELLFITPVIWFYSFFHVHNLNSMADEEFYALEDDYLIRRNSFPFMNRSWIEQNHRIVAGALIILGAILLWNYLMDFLYMAMGAFSFSERMYILLHAFGDFSLRALFSVCIIVLGVQLIRHKNRTLRSEDEKKNDSRPLLPPGDDHDL